MSMNPSGEQYEITFGEHRAVVTEVGATLRVYRVDGMNIVAGYDADVFEDGRGNQLLPWPNRIRDGRYTFDGLTHQLPLTEADRHNAIHGLLRHVAWDTVSLTSDTVTQGVRLYPQPGWPGILEVSITHSLSSNGLRVDMLATNIGSKPFPFGYGAHPFISVGEDAVDEVTLEVPAASYLEVDERLLPVRISPVVGTEKDFRSPHTLAQVKLDTAFTDLARRPDGHARVRLSHRDRWAEVWVDETMNWFQLFTGNERRDIALAVEPMSCGPDAFSQGPTDGSAVVLQAGESCACHWGITGGRTSGSRRVSVP